MIREAGVGPAERPPRILVVDDDRRVLELLDLALSAHGFQVLTALDTSHPRVRSRPFS